jgi:uncharacterized protein (DUF4415 family)
MPKARGRPPEITDEDEARLQAGIAADPDALELTDEQLARMRPARDALPSSLFAALARPRGRPRAQVTKVPVKLRLDPVALAAFKATGPGWHTRMNDALVEAARRLQPPPSPAPVKKSGSA